MSLTISKIEKEFIFKFLIQNQIKIEIRIKKYTIDALILEQNSKELKLELLYLSEHIKENNEIDVFFYFQNNYHKFRSKVIKTQGNIAIINNPQNITKNLQRKFERVDISGELQLKFSIKGDLIKLNFPETSVHYYPNKPPIDADFFDIKIDKILNKFKEKMSTLVSINKIKMLRNNTPVSYEEQMIIKYGKILYIPSTALDLPHKQIHPNLNILLKTDWFKFEMLKNKTQAFQVNKILAEYLKEMTNESIYSKAIFPVLYRNYIVALIYLINNSFNQTPISLKILNYAFQFTRVLSYALKENGYFKEEEKNTQRYIVPINDLSPGGLAFKHDNNFFEDKLLLNHNVTFLLEIEDKKINILAKLVRKFRKENEYFYGFMYLEIKKSDFDFLNKYLYNKLYG